MKRNLIAGVMLLALLATSCIGTVIEGSGNVVTETREVRGFDSVALSGIGEVVLTQGETEGLTVRADDNLMEYIDTEVRGGTLYIGLTRAATMVTIRPSEPYLFEVAFSELSGLSLSGSGSLEVTPLTTGFLDLSLSGSGGISVGGLVTERLQASISGSGELNIEGEARAQSVSVSGSGGYRAQDLVTRDASVSLSGSGVVVLHATDHLDVEIAGSGTVRYVGDPEITESITGSGGLERAESGGM
jgi:hypothetical protein